MKTLFKIGCVASSLGLLSACVDVPAPPASVVTQASDAGAQRFIITVDGPAGRAAVGQQAAILRDLPSASAVAAELPPAALANLQNNPHIKLIEADAKRHLSSVAPTEAPYGLAAVQADQISGGGTVKVCIIDSGLGDHHEALGHLTVTADEDPVVCKGRRCKGTGDPLFDDNGHGTHVAGTIAGTINGVNIGVAPNNVALHIVKVFTADGWAYSSDLAHAANLCAAAGAKIINMSLGGAQPTTAERTTFDTLYAGGVLSIAAAGNDGDTTYSYPASYDSVVSVAAVDSSNVIADFSQQTDQVELAAPGVSVLSSTPWNAAADVTVLGNTTHGIGVEFAATGSATGPLVHGGLCDSVTDFTGKVVLCDRGGISFYDKVSNAQLGGAVAVVIANNEPGGLSATLGAGNSSTIPAIGVTQDEGATLAAAAGNDATVASFSEFPASGYEAWNGTSMATPHVVGVAALVWSKHPSASVSELRSALQNSALDLGDPGRDNAFGFGLVQAAAADAAMPAPCTPSSETELSCNDGIDDDCDGAVDGADLDCCVITEAMEATCNDGVDNDCNGFADGDDAACTPEPPQCTAGAPGDSCTSNGDCCSNKCKGRTGSQTCA